MNTSEETPVQFSIKLEVDCNSSRDQSFEYAGWAYLVWESELANGSNPTVGWEILLGGPLSPPQARHKTGPLDLTTQDAYYTVFPDGIGRSTWSFTFEETRPSVTREILPIFMCQRPVESRAYMNITGEVSTVTAGWKSVSASNLHSTTADFYHYSAAGVYGKNLRAAWDVINTSDVFFFGFWTDIRAPSQMIIQPHLQVEMDGEVLVDELVENQQDWVFTNRTGHVSYHVPEVAFANGWLEMLFFAVDSEPQVFAQPAAKDGQS
jgi:hypothetical protein